MSIIYDALQKTQRNREYFHGQKGYTPTKSHRQAYLITGLSLAVLAILGGGFWAAQHYGSKATKPLNARKTRLLQTPVQVPKASVEAAHLWFTENQSKAQPLAELKRELKTEVLAPTLAQKEEPRVYSSSEASQEAPEAPAYMNRLTLNGVLISDNEKLALINNQAFRVGDLIDGMRIVSIDPTRVRLQSGSDLLELRVPV